MSTRHVVTWRCARALLEGAKRGGLDAAALVRDLPFDEATLSANRWIAWSDYCTMVERLERACGGSDALEWFMVETLPYGEEMYALAGAFVDAVSYFKLVLGVVSRLNFPTLDNDWTVRSRRTVDARYRIRDGARGCTAFQRLSIGAYRAIPRYLGLPAASVDAEYDERTFQGRIVFPESRTLVSRAKRRANAEMETLARMLGMIAAETQERTAGVSDAQRTQAFAAAHGLTARHRQVLEALVAGRSNKAIADELGCTINTIEVHVTKILRRVGVQGRAELVAHFWRSTAS